MERNVMAMEASNHEADDSEAKQKWEQPDKDDSDTDDKDDSENDDYDDSVTDDSERRWQHWNWRHNLVFKVSKLTTKGKGKG